MLGIALAALGMLTTLSTGLAIDAYGPISDNAGGIAEMAGMGECVGVGGRGGCCWWEGGPGRQGYSKMESGMQLSASQHSCLQPTSHACMRQGNLVCGGGGVRVENFLHQGCPISNTVGGIAEMAGMGECCQGNWGDMTDNEGLHMRAAASPAYCS